MSPARTLVELLSRHVTLRRRLPSELGGATLWVTPDSALRFWLPGARWLDSRLVSWARELVAPGHRVWDVGANVGVFSAVAAALAGPTGTVVAIEADPGLVALLRRTARSLPEGHAPLTVVEAAIDSAEGRVHLHVARRGRSANFIDPASASTQHGGTRRTVSVPARTLDGLRGEHPAPDVLKIDIEGSELRALAGAGELLATARPTVLCEVHASCVAGVTALLREHDYVLWDAEAPSGRRSALARAAGETLAIPRERVEPCAP